MLDVTTIYFVAGTTIIMVACSLCYMGWKSRNHAFWEWSAACLAYGGTLTGEAFVGTMPPSFASTLIHMGYITGIILLLRGIKRFTRLPINHYFDLALFAGCAVGLASLYLLGCRPELGYLFILVFSSAVSFRCALLSYQKLPEVLESHNMLLTGSLFLLAFVFLKHPFDLLLLNNYYDGFLQGPVHPIFLLSTVALLIMIQSGMVMAELKKLEKNLARSEDQARRLVEDIEDDYYIYSHDLEGRFLYVSPSIARLFQTKVENIIGVNWRDILQISPQMRVLKEKAEAMCRQGKTPDMFHFVFTHPTIGECTLELYKRPTFDHRGRVVAMSGIARNITQRIKMENELKALAITDPLTNVANRREFIRQIKAEIQRVHRYHTCLSLLMLDIDYFKNVNDTWGHDVGDEVIKQVASVSRDQLRQSDSIYRMGGEEFAVLLPETPLDDAAKLAQRILDTVRQLSVPVSNDSISVTVSIGIAQVLTSDQSFEDVVRRADHALYQAKDGGRDQYVADSMAFSVSSSVD